MDWRLFFSFPIASCKPETLTASWVSLGGSFDLSLIAFFWAATESPVVGSSDGGGGGGAVGSNGGGTGGGGGGGHGGGGGGDGTMLVGGCGGCWKLHPDVGHWLGIDELASLVISGDEHVLESV